MAIEFHSINLKTKSENISFFKHTYIFYRNFLDFRKIHRFYEIENFVWHRANIGSLNKLIFVWVFTYFLEYSQWAQQHHSSSPSKKIKRICMLAVCVCALQCVHSVVSFTSALFALRVNYNVNTPEKSMEHRYSTTYLFNASCQMHNHTNRICYSCCCSYSYTPSFTVFVCIVTNYISMHSKCEYEMRKWSINIWKDSSVCYILCI